jgi:hypothetical protein
MTNLNQTSCEIKIPRGLSTDLADLTYDVINLSGSGERTEPCCPRKIVQNLPLNPRDIIRVGRIITIEPIKVEIPATVEDIEFDTIDRLIATPRESKPKDLAIHIFLGRANFFLGARRAFKESKKFRNGCEAVRPRVETAAELVEAMSSFKKQLEYKVGQVALQAA